MNAEDWVTGRRGQALAVVIGLIALSIVWFGAIDPIRSWFEERHGRLEQRQTLLHHMQALAASLPALRSVAADRHADGATSDAATLSGTLPGVTDAIAAADLQERLQAMAAAAGANLTAVETLPATTTGGWHRVGLRVSLNASWPVLMELVRAIKRSPARIFIDDAHFHSPIVVNRSAALPIQASMMLYAFRSSDTGSGT
jgi:hypothetical protein